MKQFEGIAIFIASVVSVVGSSVAPTPGPAAARRQIVGASFEGGPFATSRRPVPGFFVNLGGGQLDQAGRLQGANLGDPLPLADGFGPAVLFLADLGERAAWLSDSFGSISTIEVYARSASAVAGLYETLTELLVELDVAARHSTACSSWRTAPSLSPILS